MSDTKPSAVVKPISNKYVESARETLLDAAERGYTNVTVIGYDEEGGVSICSSHVQSAMDKLGALQVAILQTYEHWN